MTDAKKVRYNGVYPDSAKIWLFILSLFFVFFFLFLDSWMMTALWFILLVGFHICTIYDINNAVTIFPDGGVQVGALSPGYLNKRPLNTYTISGKEARASFLFPLANIAEVYKTSRPVAGPKTSVDTFFSLDAATMNTYNKKDKTVCFELKTPLDYSDALMTGDRDFWGRKQPPIQKLYVSVADPEKLVRDIRLRANLKEH